MKKLFTFVLAAMAFAACTQNDVEELTDNRVALPETLTVGFEGGDTRIELNEALKTVWTEGDEVSAFYQSYENTRWAFQGATGDRLGELMLVSGDIGQQTMDNIIVAYPYDANYRINIENRALHASLPAVQSYKEGSYGSEGNIMVAQSEFTQFSLKSVCGWLRVELTGEGEVVESVKVRGNNGEQVAGLIYVDTATAEATLASEMGEASDEEQVGGVGGGLEFDDTVFTEVTLDCGDGVTLGAEATAFYIALLPQTFDKGMTVEINYANDNSQTLVCENSITIRRNHISPIESEANVEVEIPINQLWYTATALVEPYDATAFNVAIVSNEWNETTGEGIITFAGELTTIGDWAFIHCSSLTSVTIGNSVTTIVNGVFADCSNLTEFKGKFAADGGRCLIKDNTLIAYAEASGTTYTIPDSVTTIGERAFYWCSSLTSVTIGDSVTTIGNYAFYNCDSLTSVTIPDSVTTIGQSAFDNCSSLTSVTIPDSVTTIGYQAFYDCSRLTSVYITDVAAWCNIAFDDYSSNPLYYANALYLNNNLVTELTIPDSVTTIGDEAFRNCDSLTSVTIPDSVTTIGGRAFSNCDSLTSVTIPDSVTMIGVEAFYACNSLTSVTIGDSVTTIGERGFQDCRRLTSVTIGDSVTTIGERAFQDCHSLTSVTIPDSVTTIGNNAFQDCHSLTSVTIGDSVTTIGEYAFYECRSLTSVTIGDSVTTIGYQAFYDCSRLTSVTIPDSVTTIGGSAFRSCTSLTSVTIGDSVTTIGDDAFWGCSSLTSVYITDVAAWCNISFVNSISNPLYRAKALYLNNELVTELTIPDSVTTIAYFAFYNCYSLTSVTIPDSVTTIGYAAFGNCNSLTSVTIGDSVTTIGDSAFSSCSSLTSVTIPDSVTTIGERAFYWCSSLTSVTIPDSVTTIDGRAFEYCTNLTSVYCKATTPPKLGYYVFDYNADGRKIYVPAESVGAYKAVLRWGNYAADIVGYDFETGVVVE